MDKEKKYCKNCDDYTLSLRPGKAGSWFYGCSNFPSCRTTMASGVVESENPEPVDHAQADAEDAERLSASVRRGAEELTALALKHGVATLADELARMRASIPGFGAKLIDELTDAERELRIDYFANRIAAMQGRALPYDKTKPVH